MLVAHAAGWLATRVFLGSDDLTARARVESDVRRSFNTMARRLRDMADTAANPATVQAAVEDDVAAARELFALASHTVVEGPGVELALTVYSADGRPVAWAGRPSELASDRLQGKESWFVAPGALGLRLVYVTPVFGAASSRIGAVAAERALTSAGGAASTGLQRTSDDRFRISTRFAPVSIELPFEGAGTRQDATAFEVSAPSGDRLLTATVASTDLELTRERWRRVTASISLLVLGGAVLLLVGPLLDWRSRIRDARHDVVAVAAIAAAILAARWLMRVASPADWSDQPIFSAAAYASPLAGPLLTSAFDFLLTAFAFGGIVALLFFSVERWRLHVRHGRLTLTTPGQVAGYALTQLLAGSAVAAVLIGHAAFLRDTVAHATLDLLHFSLPPWNSSAIAIQVGLIAAHATALALAVSLFRVAHLRWAVRLRSWPVGALTIACWVVPILAWRSAGGMTLERQLPLMVAVVVVVTLAILCSPLKARYRNGSQAFRLILLTLGLIVPAFTFYPSVFQLAWQARSELVETRYAPQALNQRQMVQTQLEKSLREIDGFRGLPELVTAHGSQGRSETTTDRAFQVWQTTSLATYPITSSVELYGPDGRLVSRFAFNLPEDLTATPRSSETACRWEVVEEVAPFFAEERRVLHAGRAICAPGVADPALGSIVVHAILDYENLPFISSRSPYVEILRPADSLRDESAAGRDVEYAAYGWSRTPLYASVDTAWPLDDATFSRVEESRTPLWASLRRGSDRYDVYLLNDRGGIYALGFPVLSALGHLVNLAEVTVLAAATYVLLLGANAVFGSLSRRTNAARALFREVRASFYRKLFLAFVAAVFLPVVLLAVVTRNFVADEMRASIEQEALRTAFAAGRVVADLVGPRAAQQEVGVDDNLMVWVSRLIDQGADVFTGPRLTATSERNLFSSGLLPTRTPADVYHALTLRREAATVTRERIGTFEYLVAAAPMTLRHVDATLTVPLASRQREIEAQIDTLDRRVLLAALLFILGGAGLGYSMAERIADPVNRLTRATRRIARGDLDARIAATSSDELGRLVEDFNRMASELRRQRTELERTNRLEAWAEMARQVAHEIKNPLTPIQLNAEHLRRVHADRGEPLGPVLQDCVATILTQVKLLRQIASEFSSFASSPTAKPAPVDVQELLRDIVDPYRAGLQDRTRFEFDLPSALPRIYVDRTLITRSLTNLVENALHAMPGSGTLTVVARAEDGRVRIRVSDTGVGMDGEALARAFEPYFSTKAIGTGLGLPIAKRNVELSGGTIAVSSERDRGTTVELTLPTAADATNTSA